MRTKNIVLYGCDNSGKTTAGCDIVRMLSDAGIRCEMVHSPGPVTAVEMLDFMHTYTESTNRLDVRVFDRFPCIEEHIYGPMLRGTDKLSYFRKECNDILSKVDLFIHCKPSLDVVENWGEREQMKGVKTNARKIYDAYDEIPKVFSISDRVKYYDWTKREEPGKSLNDILKAGGVLG